MAGDDLRVPLQSRSACPPQPGLAWQAAVAEGVDMSLVERNLARSPWERLVNHDQALALALALRAAGRKLRG